MSTSTQEIHVENIFHENWANSSIYKNTEKKFPIYFRKHCNKKKGKSLIYFDY